MTNWKGIHPDFTSRLQELWERKEYSWSKPQFTPEEVQQWTNKGLNPIDYDFVHYLKRNKYDPNQKLDLIALKKEHQSNLDWEDIHKDFEDYQKHWEEKNLTYQDAQEWITIGFKPNDYDYVKEWKSHDFTPQEAKSWIEVGLTFQEHKFVTYLKQKNYQPNNLPKPIDELRNEYNWQQRGFTFKQRKGWITAGAKVDDYEFVAWLRDIKKATPNWTTNYKEDYQILSERFKKYGLCSECNQLNTGEKWCKDCNASHSRQNFINWTSHNPQIDEFIRRYQIEATDKDKFLEWIPYKQFTDIEFLAEGGFGKVYKAKWTTGNIHHWDSGQWQREKDYNEEKLTKQKNLLSQQIKTTNFDLINLVNLAKNKLKSKYLFSSKKREQRDRESEKLLNNFLDKQEKVTLLKETDNQAELNCLEGELQNAKWELSQKLSIEELENLSQMRIELTQLKTKLRLLEDKWTVVLKSLNNSSENTDFLDETAKYKIIDDWFNNIVPCYGLSQDPETGNYLMVMQYIEGGNLRHYLNNKKLTFADKLKRLTNIIQGLKDVHNKNLVHRDFHSGNILNSDIQSFITDLGLCKPADEVNKEDEIFGVLPYVAPEVLRKKGYTPASDIYSLGILAYEIFANASPYLDREYDTLLAIEICQGLRPDLEKVKIPPMLKDLIKGCWDAEPNKRPTANEIEKILRNWQKDTEFTNQLKAIEEEYNQASQNSEYKFHPTATMNSKLINTKEITRLLSQSQEASGSIYLKKTNDLDSCAINVEQNLASEQQAFQAQLPYNTPSSNK